MYQYWRSYDRSDAGMYRDYYQYEVIQGAEQKER